MATVLQPRYHSGAWRVMVKPHMQDSSGSFRAGTAGYGAVA
jgi:hypothetical protein